MSSRRQSMRMTSQTSTSTVVVTKSTFNVSSFSSSPLTKRTNEILSIGSSSSMKSPQWISGSEFVFKSPNSPVTSRRSTIHHQKRRGNDADFKIPSLMFSSPPGVKTRSRRSSIYQSTQKASTSASINIKVKVQGQQTGKAAVKRAGKTSSGKGKETKLTAAKVSSTDINLISSPVAGKLRQDGKGALSAKTKSPQGKSKASSRKSNSLNISRESSSVVTSSKVSRNKGAKNVASNLTEVVLNLVKTSPKKKDTKSKAKTTPKGKRASSSGHGGKSPGLDIFSSSPKRGRSARRQSSRQSRSITTVSTVVEISSADTLVNSEATVSAQSPSKGREISSIKRSGKSTQRKSISSPKAKGKSPTVKSPSPKRSSTGTSQQRKSVPSAKNKNKSPSPDRSRSTRTSSFKLTEVKGTPLKEEIASSQILSKKEESLTVDLTPKGKASSQKRHGKSLERKRASSSTRRGKSPSKSPSPKRARSAVRQKSSRQSKSLTEREEISEIFSETDKSVSVASSSKSKKASMPKKSGKSPQTKKTPSSGRKGKSPAVKSPSPKIARSVRRKSSRQSKIEFTDSETSVSVEIKKTPQKPPSPKAQKVSKAKQNILSPGVSPSMKKIDTQKKENRKSGSVKKTAPTPKQTGSSSRKKVNLSSVESPQTNMKGSIRKTPYVKLRRHTLSPPKSEEKQKLVPVKSNTKKNNVSEIRISSSQETQASSSTSRQMTKSSQAKTSVAKISITLKDTPNKPVASRPSRAVCLAEKINNIDIYQGRRSLTGTSSVTSSSQNTAKYTRLLESHDLTPKIPKQSNVSAFTKTMPSSVSPLMKSMDTTVKGYRNEIIGTSKSRMSSRMTPPSKSTVSQDNSYSISSRESLSVTKSRKRSFVPVEKPKQIEDLRKTLQSDSKETFDKLESSLTSTSLSPEKKIKFETEKEEIDRMVTTMLQAKEPRKQLRQPSPSANIVKGSPARVTLMKTMGASATSIDSSSFTSTRNITPSIAAPKARKILGVFDSPSTNMETSQSYTDSSSRYSRRYDSSKIGNVREGFGIRRDVREEDDESSVTGSGTLSLNRDDKEENDEATTATETESETEGTEGTEETGEEEEEDVTDSVSESETEEDYVDDRDVTFSHSSHSQRCTIS